MRRKKLPHTPGLNDWEPWQPDDVAAQLRNVSAPWHFAGGWALDLWHSFETRRHEDIEIAVLRCDFGLFRRALADMRFFCAGNCEVRHLPFDAEPSEAIHQVWCLDARTRRWKLDIMLEPGTAERWVFRRDPNIWRPRADMTGHTKDGLPFLKPAGVLLFKAKHRRAKDEQDFSKAAGKLDHSERDWLRTALERAHPGHQWAARL